MPTIKIANVNTLSSTSGITSSNVSSSLTGNMTLIKSQINNKTVDYINVKNAVKLLEKYSNWNGYIKIYTEIQSNFEVDDIVYITYLNTIESLSGSTIFNLENPSIPDEGTNRFYLGYKVLYTNIYKNEIVINRHYNDITNGYKLSNQYLSKISCRGGDLFDDISDGVVFYNCNVLNSGFGMMSGVVSGSIVSGATILCAGLKSISDMYGNYSINMPVGENIVKCSASGYITNTFPISISKNKKISKNIIMTAGVNSITITSNKSSICDYEFILFSATTIGYAEPVKYQWKKNRSGTITNIGSDNYNLVYTDFKNNDIVTCTVTDDITESTSNGINVTLTDKSVYITANNYSTSAISTTYGETVTFSAIAICYNIPTYEWKINNVIVSNSSTFSTTTLVNNDIIICVISGIMSQSITVTVLNKSINLRYNSVSDYQSCFISELNEFFINSTDFTNATKIFKNSSNVIADTGSYSIGVIYRNWNSSTQLLSISGYCSNLTIRYVGSGVQYNNNYDSCGNYSNNVNYYTTYPISIGVILYNDSSLNTPYNGDNKWISVKLNQSGTLYSLNVNVDGVILDKVNCSAITTTTTTGSSTTTTTTTGSSTTTTTTTI